VEELAVEFAVGVAVLRRVSEAVEHIDAAQGVLVGGVSVEEST